MESPDKLIADMNEAAAALVALPDGHRLSASVLHGRQLLEQLNLALEATTKLAEAAAGQRSVPEWVNDFLNRRTDVEKILREWAKDSLVHTSGDFIAIANRLTVPTEFAGRSAPAAWQVAETIAAAIEPKVRVAPYTEVKTRLQALHWAAAVARGMFPPIGGNNGKS